MRKVGEPMVDLSKMDPMARKLQVEMDAFHKAVETGNINEARSRITQIQKVADFLANDIHTVVTKAEKIGGPNNTFAGGVPIMRFNETQSVFDVANRDSLLPGVIVPARSGNIMRPWRKV